MRCVSADYSPIAHDNPLHSLVSQPTYFVHLKSGSEQVVKVV